MQRSDLPWSYRGRCSPRFPVRFRPDRLSFAGVISVKPPQYLSYNRSIFLRHIKTHSRCFFVKRLSNSHYESTEVNKYYSQTYHKVNHLESAGILTGIPVPAGTGTLSRVRGGSCSRNCVPHTPTTGPVPAPVRPH